MDNMLCTVYRLIQEDTHTFMVVTEEGICIDSWGLQFVNNKIILSNYVSLLIVDVQTLLASEVNNN